MSRNVFKAGELPSLTSSITISAPLVETDEEKEDVDLAQNVVVYDGPTVEELKAEADAFTENWEIKKNEMIEQSNLEASSIVDNARAEAEKIINEARQEANTLKTDAENDVTNIINDANEKASKIVNDATNTKDQVYDKSKTEGFQAGYDEGYVKGTEEVNRLIAKLHEILGGVAKKRADIINESEGLIVELILNSVKKVVRTIADNQKDLVVDTILKALAKLKVKADVILRVNFEDVQLATDKMKDFLKRVEKVKSITVIEDSTVDRGGCIVETDYGTIDARISSQLREIETKIRDIKPIG